MVCLGVGGGVSGGRVVGRGGVVGGLGVVSRLGLIDGVLGLTLVLDISDIARVAILNVVGHNLGAAVGKGNTVAAVGGIAITGLVGIEVNVGVAVLNSVLEVVGGGHIGVSRLVVGRPGGVVGRGAVGRGSVGVVVSQSHSGEGKNDEGLK